MATRLPALTNLGKYVSSAWAGKAACWAVMSLTLSVRVSVTPQTSLTCFASSAKEI